MRQKAVRDIYFIRSVKGDGPIKIGASKDIARRLIEINNWAPVPMQVLVFVKGDLTLERNIHDCFAKDHSHQEWFHATPRLLDCVAKLQAGLPISEAIDLSRREGKIIRPSIKTYQKMVAWLDDEETKIGRNGRAA